MNEVQIAQMIYPSVVTCVGDWKKMLEEVRKLRLAEISLFMTMVGFRERKKIYAALAKTSVVSIPHVHARNDMKEEELDYLVKMYKTEAFTIHFQFMKNFIRSKFKKKIFCENNFSPKRGDNLHDISTVGGVCIDLSHYYQFLAHTPDFHERDKKMASMFTVGCNHISAVNSDDWSSHTAHSKKEFDYLAKLPKKLFSKYLNLELSTSLHEQLEFKKYIARLLAKAWNT